MKQSLWKRALSLLLAVTLLTALAPLALAEDPVTPPTVAVTGVTLNQSTLSLEVGKTATLTATIAPANATTQTVAWSSDNAAATVDASSGVVTAVAAGTANITATTTDGSKTAICVVTVTAPPPPATVAVTGVTLNQPTLSLEVGNTATLTATIAPTNATNQAVTWSSSNTAIATVDASSGKVTAVAAGTANITVTTADGSKTATCVVTVPAPLPPAPVAVTGVTLNKSTLSLTAGSAEMLIATIAPANAANKAVTWSSSNPAAATVDANGVVTAKSTGSATITVTTMEGSKTAACVVTVPANQAAVLTASATVSSPLCLSTLQGELYNQCSYVLQSPLSFLSALSVSSNAGILYYDYVPANQTGTGIGSEPYYYWASGNQRSIGRVWFVPKLGFSGTATITYSGTSAAGTVFSGTIQVAVAAAQEFSYTATKSSPAVFRASDFNAVCWQQNGRDLQYVTFTLPSSSYGTLYYDYSSAGQYGSVVSAGTAYYRNSSPYLDRITFVPADGYRGTVRLNYQGWDTANLRCDGTLTIQADGGVGSTLSYTATANTPARFRSDDFNTACRAATGYHLNYVRFDLPSSSRGTLYVNYRSDGNYDSAVSSSTNYYRNGSLDSVYFVPVTNYTGTASIAYTGWDTNGNRYTGTVEVKIATGSSALSYTASVDSPARFASDDFNTACRAATGYHLNYVRFDLPSSSRGTLYVNYRSDGNYDSKVNASTNYYRNGSLSNVYFVPAGDSTRTVDLSYTGWDTNGNRYTGIVTIRVTASVAEVIRYTGTGAIPFRSADFNGVCRSLQGTTLSRVQFTLPSSSFGTLYYQYRDASSTTISASTAYYRGSSPDLDAVTFVPRAGFVGTVPIAYVGWDTAGRRYTGTVSVTVQKKQLVLPFSDMGSYGWAADSVAYLYDAGVVNGVTATRYDPAANITRGAFVLMLCRGFDLPTTGRIPSFSDVPADSYCAGAVATAESLWIAQGNGGRFYPDRPLTRQDAMALIQRTMRATGWSLPDGSPSLLAGFTDRNTISPHAVGAVAALVNLGIVQGDSNHQINPKASLSRAEMAVILHRVLVL